MLQPAQPCRTQQKCLQFSLNKTQNPNGCCVTLRSELCLVGVVLVTLQDANTYMAGI